MVNWRGYIYPRYMCILLYVKLIQCSGVLYIYGQLEEGVKLNVTMTLRFGVVVFHRSMVNLRRGYIYPRYMCIFLYVKLFSVLVFHRSMVIWRGVKLNVIMTQRFGVVVFHRSMVNWRKGVHLP